MRYENIIKGIFKERPNRFIAMVEIDGKIEKVHVKNTGRCRELLTANATVYLEDFEGRMGSRKLRYSLIAVEKTPNHLLINMDSQAPNKVVEEALLSGELTLPDMEILTIIRREKTFGNSRFDFYVEDENGNSGFIEVKGVTLENDGIVRFPDAPTQRGIKHIDQLISAKKEGYKAFIIFVVQIDNMKEFRPNYNTHPQFGDALIKACKEGVEILAYQCKVTPDNLKLDSPIPVILA